MYIDIVYFRYKSETYLNICQHQLFYAHVLDKLFKGNVDWVSLNIQLWIYCLGPYILKNLIRSLFHYINKVNIANLIYSMNRAMSKY